MSSTTALINVNTARLAKAREVELVCDDGTWRVAGIDPTLRPRLWRLLPRRFRGHDTEHREFIAVDRPGAACGPRSDSRLKLAARRLLRLHPAQIADLVEAASHEEGEEIMQAVRQDKELEADVFEELDDEHQVEFLRGRPDAEVAAVLSRMAPDDAADLLLELEQDRRLPVLNLLPAAKQRKLRSLLDHNPSTAGGLMTPDFVSAPITATVGEAIARVRASELGAQPVSTIVVVDDRGLLAGAVALSELVRANESDPLAGLLEAGDPAVSVEADLPEVATLDDRLQPDRDPRHGRGGTAGRDHRRRRHPGAVASGVVAPARRHRP